MTPPRTEGTETQSDLVMREFNRSQIDAVAHELRMMQPGIYKVRDFENLSPLTKRLWRNKAIHILSRAIKSRAAVGEKA